MSGVESPAVLAAVRGAVGARAAVLRIARSKAFMTFGPGAEWDRWVVAHAAEETERELLVEFLASTAHLPVVAAPPAQSGE